MIKLLNILNEMLNEASIEQLQQQFVDTNKISTKDFEAIKQASNSKGAYATWLVKKVIDKIIKSEDIYKFKKYFDIFNQYKNQFPITDINQYKSKEDIRNFISTAIKIENEIALATGTEKIESSSNLVSLQGIKELNSAGIKFLGLVDGYQCFKVPQEMSGNEKAWKTYRKYLAKCKGRKEGEGIELCTMASLEYFNDYLTEDDLYIFFNLNDKLSPYQFHYNEYQFMDKNDESIVTNTNSYNLFKFLKQKEGRKIPIESILINNPNYQLTQDDIDMNRDLDLSNTPITSLPDNLNIRGDLDLRNTPIKSLPDNLSVRDNLYLSNTPITSLPDNLSVGGSLFLKNTPITSLPDNLSVEGHLNLHNTQITSLPPGLKVEGFLWLGDTPIKSLPPDLKVRNGLYLSNTPLSRTHTEEQIRQMAPGVDCKIYM